jgi:hypothetical protein
MGCLIDRLVKVGKVRIILVIIRRYPGSKLVSDGLVLLKAQLRLSQQDQLIKGHGSRICIVCNLAVGIQDFSSHRRSNIDRRSKVAVKLHFGVGEVD